MAFVLSAQRQAETVVSAFQRYRDYLAAHASGFPSGALALASSDWYFDPSDRRCPHDAWLETVTVSEAAAGDRSDERSSVIHLRLLGAYHDGFIELFYPRVFQYSLVAPSSARGLGDWLYDEFRIAPDGHVIHEIEWAGFQGQEGSRWIIQASDVEYQWLPK